VTTTWNPATFNPHDPAFLADPYPTYAHFRDHAPISVVQPYGSAWVFRFADARQMLEDSVTFLKNPPGGNRAPATGLFSMGANLPIGLFGSDPPRHTVLRQILEPLFMEAIASAAATATTTAAQLLAPLQHTARFELVSDYAVPLPSAVLFTVMGIPADHWPVLLQWIGTMVAAHDITQSVALRSLGATCAMALNTYFEEWVLQCRTKPQAGLIGEMCQAIGGPEGLTAEDVQVCCTDFAFAGYLSTTFLIGTGLRHLLDNPDQAALLRADPTLMANAVEEMLRYDGPVQVLDRVTAVDTELGGTPLPAGTRVTAVIGSANHDPSAFADPDSFRIQRDDAAQLSFGDGIHHCIGAPLARIVTPIAMAALLELPSLAVAGLPQWQTDPYLRAMTNFPLSIGAT
jgi:cytochrome P450